MYVYNVLSEYGVVGVYTVVEVSCKLSSLKSIPLSRFRYEDLVLKHQVVALVKFSLRLRDYVISLYTFLHRSVGKCT